MDITILNAPVSAFENEKGMSFSTSVKGKDKEGNILYANIRVIANKSCTFRGGDFTKGDGHYYGYFNLKGFLVPSKLKSGDVGVALMLTAYTKAEKPEVKEVPKAKKPQTNKKPPIAGWDLKPDTGDKKKDELPF